MIRFEGLTLFRSYRGLFISGIHNEPSRNKPANTKANKHSR